MARLWVSLGALEGRLSGAPVRVCSLVHALNVSPSRLPSGYGCRCYPTAITTHTLETRMGLTLGHVMSTLSACPHACLKD